MNLGSIRLLLSGNKNDENMKDFSFSWRVHRLGQIGHYLTDGGVAERGWNSVGDDGNDLPLNRRLVFNFLSSSLLFDKETVIEARPK